MALSLFRRFFLEINLSGSDIDSSELTDRYYRRLLIGGGVVVSIVIVMAAFIIAVLLSWRYFHNAGLEFQATHNQLQQKINSIEMRADERSQSDEMLWKLHQGDRTQLPAQHYWDMLGKNQGMLVTGPDLTLIPFSLLSKPDVSTVPEYFSEVLRVSRNASAYPLIYSSALGFPAKLYVYSFDHASIMMWPTLDTEEVAQINQKGSGAFIENYIKEIDTVVKSIAATAPGQQMGIWLEGGDAYHIGSFATTIKHNGRIVAVRVVKYSSSFFMSSMKIAEDHTGYYVTAKNLDIIFNPGNVTPDASDIVRSALVGVEMSKHAKAYLHYKNGVFFHHKTIEGPNWELIHTLTWLEFFSHLQSAFLILLLATTAVLLTLWLFILFLGRMVLAPLHEEAKKVYESESFNRTILTTLPTGVAVFDSLSSVVLLQNYTAQEMLAFSSEGDDLYRRLLEEYPRPASGFSHDVSETAEVQVFDTLVDAGNGEKRELSVTFIRTRYMQKEVVLFGMIDVTEQRAAVVLLEKAKEAANQANIAKSLFLAMMSHEIRTPLHGALGNLELLALESLTPPQHVRVTTIRRAFDSLLIIINDVLDLSKLEAKKLYLSPEPFQLDELVERCAQTFAPLILEKNINFTCFVDPDLSGDWIGDAHRINQVMMNLLSNARKFTEVGSITLRATKGEVCDDLVWVRLSIADTGIGISEEHQKHIFEPFAQADASVSKRFGGTGLGLTLCKKVTELSGGNIAVDSELGEGSLFTVNIPLTRGSEAASSVASAEYRFDRIMLVCSSLLWQLHLVKQLQVWAPGVTLVEADFNQPGSLGDKQTVLVLAGFDERGPPSWLALTPSYLDTLLVSAAGPLYPQRRKTYLYVTSLSSSMLKLALSACGNGNEILEKEAAIETSQHRAHAAVKVLVVEDDALNRTLLEQQLEALGYADVDSASNGQEGLDLCLVRSYDVIVSDLGMPIMDGQMLLSALRDRNILTPVILSTAETGGELVGKSSGFATIMHKPITMEVLSTALDQVLGSRQPLAGPPGGAPNKVLQLEEMQAVFLAGWEADEKALRAALDAQDTKGFLGRLHRLKGALLVLEQNSLVISGDQLKRAIDEQGLLSVTTLAEHFLLQVNQAIAPQRHV